MHGTVGIFVGSSASFNIVRDASNIGQALSEEFTTQLISTDVSFVDEVSKFYNDIHGVNNDNSLSGEVTALRSYLHSHSPDALLQVTNPPIHGTVVGCLAKLHGIPFVYRYSGDRFYEYRVSEGVDKIPHFGLNNVLGRVPIHLADAHIVLGPTGRQRLESRGVDPDDISIIPPSVDRERFSVSGTSTSFNPDRHTGLFVGRLSRRKGKQTLERTLPNILDRRDDLEFVFIGEQPEHLNIRSEYEEFITTLGPVPPSEMPRYFRGADFLIHPSLTEGLPRVVLEALASGIPPIARDVGDIAYATQNTFESDRKFIEMVCNFESLDVNSVDNFLYQTVGRKYIMMLREVTDKW